MLSRRLCPGEADMARLLLMRHAKSSWAGREGDHARPLNDRGVAAANLMAERLAAQSLLPDRLLCSTARRTRQTLLPIVERLDNACEIVLTPLLYQGAEDYLDVIRILHEGARTLMLLGHNPMTHRTALTLGGSEAAVRFASKYPTAAVAIFDCPNGFDGLSAGDARLEAFLTPGDPA